MPDDTYVGTFEKLVPVATGTGERLVSSASEAAEMLLYNWPIGETATRIQARMACMKALAPCVRARSIRAGGGRGKDPDRGATG